MWNVHVNGKTHQSETDMSLMDFLREELRLTSVKNGCREGACGTCAVSIDGKAMRSCLPTLSRLDGKKIQTVEGLTAREKEVFAYAFASAGAVQCGFCTPGMVIAAKCLLDQNPDPTRAEVKQALRGHYCRCTGYIKIEDAILLAAKIQREDTDIAKVEPSGRVGESTVCAEATAKVLGLARYADDDKPEGMLYGKNVFTRYARAEILSIDTAEALALPGVVAVYTAKDIPGNRYIGHLAKDQAGMIAVGEQTTCIGDTLALVVAETREQAERGAKAVQVAYKALRPILSPAEAAAPDAHQIHGGGFMQFGAFRIPQNNVCHYEKIENGDADAALARSKYVAEATFRVPPVEHAFMEPETAIGLPEGSGVRVISSDQGVYNVRQEIMEYLALPADQVHIQAAVVGGGFGGKEDLSVQHHAALCAYLSKRPVKVSLSRQESIRFHPKRHGMEISLQLGCDENGILQGLKATIIADTGAFASLGGPVLQRACTHLGGPYHYQNVHIEGWAYYTNNPPAGAFRGFGVAQSTLAIECLVNALAEQAGLSGWEMRYRNAIRPGQALPNKQIADESTAMAETLEAVKADFEKYEAHPDYHVGIASALKNTGLGTGVPDIGRCNLEVRGGKVYVKSSAAEIGQGIKTVLAQMVCEKTGLAPDQVVPLRSDTRLTPDSGMTTASRQTVFAGEAACRAAAQLKADLDSGLALGDLEGKEYKGEFEFKTDPLGSPKAHPVSHIAYGYATQLVVIDKAGKLAAVVAAHDLGKVVNPLAAEGQVEGAVAMGLGYGLTETFPLKDGVPQAKLGTLGLPRADFMPPVTIHWVEKSGPGGVACGAKGLGEIGACMAAPACQNAYYKKDGVFRTRLPLDGTAYRP